MDEAHSQDKEPAAITPPSGLLTLLEAAESRDGLFFTANKMMSNQLTISMKSDLKAVSAREATDTSCSHRRAAPVKHVPSSSLMEELNLIPDDEKQDFLEAVKLADPSVLENEANPAMFLLVENNQAPQAAKRLVTYWKRRKNLFGERAYLPVLDLSGNGALSNEEIPPFEKLKGKILLPDDPTGRKVICLDDAERPPEFMQIGPAARLRVLFYWLTAAAMATPLSQTNGMVLLRVIRQADGDITKSLEGAAMMIEAMPMKIHSMHFCCIPPEGHRRQFMETYMPVFLQIMGMKLANITKVHVEDEKGSLVYKLEACGLRKGCLPVRMGGTWSGDDADSQKLTSSPILGSMGHVEALQREKLAQRLHSVETKRYASLHKPSVLRNEDLTKHSWSGAVEDRLLKERTQAKISSVDMNAVTTNEKPECPTKRVSKSLTMDPFTESTSCHPRNEAFTCAAELAFSSLAEELSLIPDEEKQAYHEAIEVMDPTVMEREASATMFLLVANNQAPQAARRLVTYWKYRKDAFGERAFLPLLDLSGTGALVVEDIHAITSCNGVVLPDDSVGRKVLCFDDAVLDPYFKLGAQRPRCLFYWFTLAAVATQQSQTDGVIMLRVARKGAFDRNSFVKMSALVTEVLPVKLYAFHLCCIPQNGQRKYFMNTFVPIYVQLLGKVIGSCTKIHVADESVSLAAELTACGLRMDGLPLTLGGIWSNDGVALQAKEELTAPVSAGALVNLADAAQQALMDERKARKRHMDVIYARKRRQQDKGGEKRLQMKFDEVMNTNERLRDENAKLEHLFLDAKMKVALIEFGMPINPHPSKRSASSKLAAFSEGAKAIRHHSDPSLVRGSDRENEFILYAKKMANAPQALQTSTSNLQFFENHAMKQPLDMKHPGAATRNVALMQANRLQLDQSSRAMLAWLQQQSETKSSDRVESFQTSQHQLAAMQADQLLNFMEAQSWLQKVARSTEEVSRSPNLLHLVASMETQPLLSNGIQMAAFGQPPYQVTVPGPGLSQSLGFASLSTNPLGQSIPQSPIIGSILQSGIHQKPAVAVSAGPVLHVELTSVE